MPIQHITRGDVILQRGTKGIQEELHVQLAPPKDSAVLKGPIGSHKSLSCFVTSASFNWDIPSWQTYLVTHIEHLVVRLPPLGNPVCGEGEKGGPFPSVLWGVGQRLMSMTASLLKTPGLIRQTQVVRLQEHFRALHVLHSTSSHSEELHKKVV